MKLLARDALVKTGDVDHAAWNYEGLLGFIARTRFRMAVALLPPEPVDALLEIGYGSGVFMPELALHARRLSGADVHEHAGEVERALCGAGVGAHLVVAAAELLPFPGASFDVVVVVSAFEFVSDPVLAADEISRVLKPDGCAIVVTPGVSPLLDLALRLLTGADPRKDFGRRREAVIPALSSRLRLDKMIAFPKRGGPKLYRALRLVRR
jgi:ubiquinone/menaquinone biosynthesis C-methylase UbiE